MFDIILKWKSQVEIAGTFKRLFQKVMLLFENVANRIEETNVEGFGNPIKTAWIIISIGFLTFCLLCIGTTLWANYFFFESTVRLETVLRVGSGTIGIQAGSTAEQRETGVRFLQVNSTIRTDPTNILSQATLTFFDPSLDDQLIATVTLRSGTSVRLLSAQRPRFDFTSGIYRIEIEDALGDIDVFVANQLQRELLISIQSWDNFEIRILGPGKYMLEIGETTATVVNRSGVTVIIPPEPLLPKSIPPGNQGLYSRESGSISVDSTFVNLISNSELRTFSPNQDEVVNDEFQDIASGWQCFVNFENVNRIPLGSYFGDTAPDGRPGFHLLREGASNNVATGCTQELEGIDISGFSELRLQVSLYVDHQSLSGCGTQASECPLMMLIVFADQQGRDLVWRHGVYAALDPASPWPLRCDTCRQDHYRVYQDTWYTYDSGNLFTVFPPGERPARIKRVSFYASGHNYDVYLNEIALFAGIASEFINGGVDGDA